MVERRQLQHLSLPDDERLVLRSIPMEKLSLIEVNPVKMLSYQSPHRFSVYLKHKIETHLKIQSELQKTMERRRAPAAATPRYARYQAIGFQDNNNIWHRAIVLDHPSSSPDVRVYFVDFGEEKRVEIANTYPLPDEFSRQPAFAIPCRLNGIRPRDGNQQSNWEVNDPVHEEFVQLMRTVVNCKVCEEVEYTCYDVRIEVPDVGDLATFLLRENLVSSSRLNTPAPPAVMYNATSAHQPSSLRAPPGFSSLAGGTQQRMPPQNDVYHGASSTVQPPAARAPQRLPTQPTSNVRTSAVFSSDIRSLPPQDGFYMITHVYSAVEFYGYSLGREKELLALQRNMEDTYNNVAANDQSLGVHLFFEGTSCAIHKDDKYRRVTIINRESESRVLVKLVDRGDSTIVDTSELLKLEDRCLSVPAFVQPFRLHNYDEAQPSAYATRNLKRLILNQRVKITQHAPAINGFHSVEVRLANETLITQSLLSRSNIPVQPTRQSEDTTESRPQPEMSSLRNNDDLPPPQKLLTAPGAGRPQSAGFMSNQSNANDPASRYSRMTNGTSQAPAEQTRTFNRGMNNDEQRKDNFPRFSNDESRQGFNREERSNFGDRNFDRNNRDNDNQRSFGFNSRGGGFGDRAQSGYGDRSNNDSRGGGFGARGRGFGNRGDRGGSSGNFSSHSNFNGDTNDGGAPRSQGFGVRGRYNDGRPGGGDRSSNFNDGGNQRGGLMDRGGQRPDRGGRGGRGRPFGDQPNRNNDDFRSNDENTVPGRSFSGWPGKQTTAAPFEAGNRFPEQDMPADSFQFVFSNFETCKDFFIQLVSKTSQISQMTNDLQDEFSKAPELPASSAKPGQICLARSSDGCWYRAVVLASNFTKTKIRFVDYGDVADVDAQHMRQLATKFCTSPPYAYHCTLSDIEGLEKFNMDAFIKKEPAKQFNGKLEKKTTDAKYVLQSDELERAVLGDNAPKSRSEKTIQCMIVYVDDAQHQFCVQNDENTANKILTEVANANEPTGDDVHVNSLVISTFDDTPYRALVQEDLGDNVKVLFVDYGNVDTCAKSSLKKCSEQLKAYPHQAKRCELAGVAEGELAQAFDQLQEHIEAEETKVTIVKQSDDLWIVRLHIAGECFNDKFASAAAPSETHETSVDMDDQASVTTTTTVREQERPTSGTSKRNNEEILSPEMNSTTTSTVFKRQKSTSETEVSSTRHHSGILTHFDQTNPVVYLQLLPESETLLDTVTDLINTIVSADRHETSYEVGDYCIATFTDDGNLYRARIESHSASANTYAVYFLDYGNVDEHVPVDHLYSYSDELRAIEPLAHKFTLEKQTAETWAQLVLPLLESKTNDEFRFYFTDAAESTIHIQFENEEQMYNHAKTLTANISGTYKDRFYIHVLPDVEALICEMDELLHIHSDQRQAGDSWQVDDRCIVFNRDTQHYLRGKILTVDGDTFAVQCIDFGYVLPNCTKDEVFVLTGDDMFQQKALARPCRLHGVADEQQVKAVDEVIKEIKPTERVTITVNGDGNDECMSVMLFREDHDIVNDRYRTNAENPAPVDAERKTALSPDGSDSAIAADVETPTTENPFIAADQQLTSPFGAPQADSTHRYGNMADETVGAGQSIDFGENDPSTMNTTIKEDAENEQ